MLSASYQFCCLLFAIMVLFLPLWYFSYKSFPLFFWGGGIFLGENIADLEESAYVLEEVRRPTFRGSHTPTESGFSAAIVLFCLTMSTC